MSLGISIEGSFTSGRTGRDMLQEIGEWLSERCDELLEDAVSAWEPEEGEEGPSGLAAELHPCAEALTIELDDGIQVSANTTSAGPGYHQFVCTLLDEMGEEFGISWDAGDEEEGADETGYFVHRDRSRLEASMLQWLGGVATSLTEHEGETESIAIAMSADHQFDAGKAIVTPLGPRAWEWAEATARDARSSRGFFAWWDEGETGRARLNRALARMWATVRWVAPRNEEEARVLALTLRDLEIAWELDPTLDFPAREWLELGGFVDTPPSAEADVRARAAKAKGPLIGYRRGQVRVLLPGGWNIRIPGSFSETFEEEGGFLAWDETRNVRVSSFSIRCCEEEGHSHELPTPEQMLQEDVDADLPPALEELDPWEEEGRKGIARLFRDEDEGEEYWVLMGKVATEGRLALCTVCYERDEDRAWAEQTLRSLRD